MTAASEVFPGRRGQHRALGVHGRRLLLRGAGARAVHAVGAAAHRGADARDRARPTSRSRRTPMSVAEAMALFRTRGEDERVRLLAHRAEGDGGPAHALRGRQDYFQGYMVPSTGCLKHFALHAFPPGFLLQFPHQSRPTEIAPFTPYPKLFEVFEEAGHWLDRLGIRSAGALNDAIGAGRLAEVSLVGRGAARGAHRADRRATSPRQGDRVKRRADRRALVVGQDDVLQAAGRAAAGERPAAVPDRPRRLLRGPRADAARRERAVRLRVPARRSTSRCSTSTC